MNHIVCMAPRNCSKVQGKLSNYSFCMQRVKQFQIIHLLNDLIGRPKGREWDVMKPVSDGMQDAGALKSSETYAHANSDGGARMGNTG
jgi:hypothetical protein